MKKTAVLSPSKPQMLRSAYPYFLPAGTDLRGEIATSKTSGGRAFVVYLPPGHDPDITSHQILYHLHGAGVPWRWVEKDLRWIAAAHEEAVRAGTIEPTVIVAAYDPTHFSMWTDSADGTNNQASAVIDELIPYVESTYNVQPERGSRFLQGFSMGGFGAATLGLKRQDLFGAIAIWDGALHDWDTINRGRPKIAANQFSNNEQHFDEWSPWAWAERADLTRTPILIVSGLMVDFADRYTRHLTELGANLTREAADCFHDLRCLERTHGQSAFQFFAEV